MDKDVLSLIKEKGLLLEKAVYDLIEGLNNETAKRFIEQIISAAGQKMITRNVLVKNVGFVRGFVEELPGGEKQIVEKVLINLGISLEVVRSVEEKPIVKNNEISYKIFYAKKMKDKKLEVKDFVGHFRSRYQMLQRILMQRAELQKNLMSINKISSDRASFNIIGLVKEKRVTKNKNLIITFEDMTGQISGLVKFDKQELFNKADELQVDDVVGIKASGNRDMLFLHDIFYPDSFIHEKVKFDSDVSIAFISDLHCGSDRHLTESFSRFLEWINSEDELAKKIKFIFFVGDNVDGVGIFPGQERVLKLKSMNEQYALLADYLKRIPKDKTMFMIPGQHDAVRVAEPQPIIGRKYAPQLYEIENLILATNPSLVKLYEKDKEFKILMYHGASIHAFINEIKELRESKAHRTPARAIRHMLKRRHLAPMHGVSASIVYIPTEDEDPMVITQVPDVLCTGEVHRLDIENYNGTTIITGSCWQAQTPFEEKVGNIPDPCKVPILNLKTRELKILDFGIEEEINYEY